MAEEKKKPRSGFLEALTSMKKSLGGKGEVRRRVKQARKAGKSMEKPARSIVNQALKMFGQSPVSKDEEDMVRKRAKSGMKAMGDFLGRRGGKSPKLSKEKLKSLREKFGKSE